MRLPTLTVLTVAALQAAAAPPAYAPIEPRVLMPDGSPFLTWSDQTRYERTYHVDQQHPAASDDNPGSAARPLRTISRAAALVKAGERVLIHAGVYRELVQPRNEGAGPDRMIAYEAAPGEQVILKGSRVLEGKWVRSVDPRGEGGRSLYSRRLWMTALPDALFEDGYFAFRTPNASDAEIDLMSWALRWKGRIPYTLPRGLLFQDGKRMVQLATYEDLVRLPGSYWVSPDGKTVHVHPFGGTDPNGKFFEAAVQSHIFRPERAGLGFIRVSGLILEQCANGFPRIGVGALFTMGGHHWIIERNTVRHVNSVGIEMGYDIFERQDKRYVKRPEPDLGHTIVRGNRIYECGTAGIRSHTVSFALVEDNYISDCGWQDVEYYWEMAGIKMLINQGTLVRNNRIARIQSACGIWLDWNNRNSRVTGNVIWDVVTAQGAVFVEASQQPNMVDHNVFWNIDGQGVRVADTDNLTIAHNLFGLIKEDLVYARVATDRSLGGRKLTSTGNRIVNNIFVDAARPIILNAGNTADYNVYLSTTSGEPVKPLTGETHSVSMKGEVRFDGRGLLLTWNPERTLPFVPAIGGCDRDFAGQPWDAGGVTPGPFGALRHSTSVDISSINNILQTSLNSGIFSLKNEPGGLV